MSHILDLPSILQQQALFRANIDEIRTQVIFKGSVLLQTGTQPGGQPIFDTVYTDVSVDVSDWLIQGGIQVSEERSLVPGSRNQSNGKEVTIKYGEITVVLDNSKTYWAVTQSGAIIDTQNIESATIEIYALLSTTLNTPIPIFKGTVKGLPLEERGQTTFKVASQLWDAIRRPIVYENYGQLPTGIQAVFSQDDQLYAGAPEVTNQFGTFCVLQALGRWSANGEVAVEVENNKPDTITLNSMKIANEAPLGRYRIEFRNATRFDLIYPDNTSFAGTIREDTITPFITLEPISFGGIVEEGVETIDGTGAEIEFQLFYSVAGNPVAIIFNLLEKALLGNTGSIPGQVATVAIDQPAFAAAFEIFKDFRVHVDITNKDNAVFTDQIGSRPVNYLAVAQQVADHINCFIDLLPNGLITIGTPFMDDTDIWDIDTEKAVTDHKLRPPSKKFNRIAIQYGFDTAAGTYAATLADDLRPNTDIEIVNQAIQLPFYKIGKGDWGVHWLRDTLIRKYAGKQIGIPAGVTPNFALVASPGDRVRFVSNIQPVYTTYAEVRKVTRKIGRVGSYELVPIDDPEGEPFTVCNGEFENQVLV